MASELTFYSKAKQFMLDGTLDLDANTIKLMLVTSVYTFDVAHEVLADVKASPDPEVLAVASPDNGYTAGGETLVSAAVTHTDAPSQAKFDAEDVTWTSLTATFRYGILYAEGTLNGVVDPLIACILFDTTPADVTISGINYVVQWSANGIFTLA
ncbi:MAG: hypothetical protein WCJ37_01080 [Syntrophus sp. (in: bacteria)]